MPRDTVRLTVAQAIVTYLSKQYSVADGQRRRLIPAALGIFGHGNVAGLGQALDQLSDTLPFIQGRNEQALVHVATAYAKASRRHATLAVTASIGPGALNMVTGAGVATVNRLPVLLLPGDSYATRRQGPVLQQLQHPVEADTSVNDAFRPLARFFDRITRPEQIVPALTRAVGVLTDPAECGPVTLALCQDVQAEAFDYPEDLFEERILVPRRIRPDEGELAMAAHLLASARKPLVIAGGGVLYSEAEAAFRAFIEAHGLPIGETQAGKSTLPHNHPLNLGGIGVTGTGAANALAEEADVILAVGAADPIGLARFLRAHADLLELVGPEPVRVVVTKVRSAAVGMSPASQIAATLLRFGGIADPYLVPWDPAAFDAALLAGRTLQEAAPRSPALAALRQLVRRELVPSDPGAARVPLRRRLRDALRGGTGPATPPIGAA